jgi:hypothetical protein
MEAKTVVGSGRLNMVARQKAMDGGGPLKTGMNCRRFGTTPVPTPFLRHFLGEQKETRRRNRVQAEASIKIDTGGVYPSVLYYITIINRI